MAPGLAIPVTTQPMSPATLAGLGLKQGASESAEPSSADERKKPRRRSRLPIVLVLVVVVLGGVGAGVWFFGDRLGLDLGKLDAFPRGPGKR
jgi:hypothetical protein